MMAFRREDIIYVAETDRLGELVRLPLPSDLSRLPRAAYERYVSYIMQCVLNYAYAHGFSGLYRRDRFNEMVKLVTNSSANPYRHRVMDGYDWQWHREVVASMLGYVCGDSELRMELTTCNMGESVNVRLKIVEGNNMTYQLLEFRFTRYLKEGTHVDDYYHRH